MSGWGLNCRIPSGRHVGCSAGRHAMIRGGGVAVGAALLGCSPDPGALEVFLAQTKTVTAGPLAVGKDLGLLIAPRVPTGASRDEYDPPADLEIVADDMAGVRID